MRTTARRVIMVETSIKPAPAKKRPNCFMDLDEDGVVGTLLNVEDIWAASEVVGDDEAVLFEGARELSVMAATRRSVGRGRALVERGSSLRRRAWLERSGRQRYVEKQSDLEWENNEPTMQVSGILTDQNKS